MDEPPIYFIDFEGNRRYGVVEYGVAEWQAGNFTQCWTRLCKPTGEIDPRDARLHGIRNPDTINAAPFTQEETFFTNLRRKGVFAAHHAQIENTLLKDTWPYPGRCPDFATGGETNRWGPWLDTRRLLEHALPGQESHKLGDLLEALGLNDKLKHLAEKHCPPHRSQAHCALYDALGSGLLFTWLRQQEGWQKLPLARLLELCKPGNDVGQSELF